MDADLRRCKQCATVYDPRKSSSRWLHLTYCSATCERKDQGFLIEDFDDVYRAHPVIPEDPELAKAYDSLVGRH